MPGNTPYVRNDRELEGFLRRIDEYCEYFFGACSGVPATPQSLRVMFPRVVSADETGGMGLAGRENE